jgi:hypothetical protein
MNALLKTIEQQIEKKVRDSLSMQGCEVEEDMVEMLVAFRTEQMAIRLVDVFDVAQP